MLSSIARRQGAPTRAASNIARAGHWFKPPALAPMARPGAKLMSTDAAEESTPARHVPTIEVIISKIFPAGFGWQGASVVAGQQGYEADQLGFFLMTGAGDFAGVFAGHLAFTTLKAVVSGKPDPVGGLWLATAAFCSGTAWQPTVNVRAPSPLDPCHSRAAPTLNSSSRCLVCAVPARRRGLRLRHDRRRLRLHHRLLLLRRVSGSAECTRGAHPPAPHTCLHAPTRAHPLTPTSLPATRDSLRIGRIIYAPLGLEPANYANLCGDAMLSASIGAATGTFVGTDISFGAANPLRPFFGVEDSMSDLEGCIRAGASTSAGFFVLQTTQNLLLPKDANWLDPVKIEAK